MDEDDPPIENPSRELIPCPQPHRRGGETNTKTSLEDRFPPVGDMRDDEMLTLPSLPPPEPTIKRSKLEESNLSLFPRSPTRLITSRDKELQIRSEGRMTDQGQEEAMDDHARLVDRVTLALQDKGSGMVHGDQDMEEVNDKGKGKELFDDDMPLAQLQKEAKMEALARRDKAKDGVHRIPEW
ncbi:hypothetical protein J5N97_014151 [Dioscorea zingiberensis]|uniref:Uncharacterized protein n=1 Tax=Dioscorea zingiberensis TaxID=325984 RepID=A0A9D5HJS6_9LILI|nr:hypothetical protein J5N97_014151 [Dioscorea zingiberensis]